MNNEIQKRWWSYDLFGLESKQNEPKPRILSIAGNKHAKSEIKKKDKE